MSPFSDLELLNLTMDSPFERGRTHGQHLRAGVLKMGEIRLELMADDAKMVEIALLNQEIPVRHLPQRGPGAGPTALQVDGESGFVRLIVQDLGQRRNRKRDRVRLDVEALRNRVEQS